MNVKSLLVYLGVSGLAERDVHLSPIHASDNRAIATEGGSGVRLSRADLPYDQTRASANGIAVKETYLDDPRSQEPDC
jgi:hypothetical protein